MAEVESAASNAILSGRQIGLRLLYVCLWLVLFCVGYGAAAMLSLPFVLPDNWVSLLYALAQNELLSLQTVILFNVATYFGRPFDSPSAPRRQSANVPRWLLKHPYGAICLGLTIFISPWLIALGLSGIAYALAAGWVLYSASRLLSHGPAGAVLLMIAWAMAGFFLAKLIFTVPGVHSCTMADHWICAQVFPSLARISSFFKT